MHDWLTKWFIFYINESQRLHAGCYNDIMLEYYRMFLKGCGLVHKWFNSSGHLLSLNDMKVAIGK